MSAPVTQKKVRSAGEMSPGRLALRRFLSNKLALVGGITLIVIAMLSLFAPFIAQHDPTSVDLSAIRQAPSAVHWLGTDDAGRDVFARFLYAGRVSLVVGLLAALLSVVIGSIVGAIAGLLGGWVDVALMRLADIFLSFPSLVVVMAVAGILGPSVTMLILAIGLFEWPAAARVVRGISLQTRELEYVQAARGAGARSTWLIVRHLLPASLIPIVVVASLGVASAILLEAALSFLGLGVQPPQSSWGNMLNAAQSLTVISTMPWLWLPPGLAVAVTVLAVNFVGDGLRDAVDPRRASRGRKRKSTKGFPS